MDSNAPARDFPPDVHQSLAELRRVAKSAKSRHDVRRATAEEIALSETLRQPGRCRAHSSRTGLACDARAIAGGTVCVRHGGQMRRVKLKAQGRLAAAALPVIDAMVTIATQSENLNAAAKAGSDLLDRCGIGELTESRIRASKRESGGPRIEVRIGFLQQLGIGEPTPLAGGLKPSDD